MDPGNGRAGGPARLASMTHAPVIPAVGLPGGAAMPLVGFGTWQLRGRNAYQAVRAALDAGYRHLDTASMYRNEREVGRALRESGIDRRDVFVTTKMWPSGAGHERREIATSLDALGLGHVDLWLVHWPTDERQLTSVWREFLTLRDEGLARAVGVSNHSLAQIDRLAAETGEGPAVNQVPWGPGRHDPRLLAGHRERGVVLEGYSPLKNADLSHPVLAEVAASHGVAPAQVVLRWHVEHGVAVIPKSGRAARIAANIDLFGFALSPAEVARIDSLSRSG